MDAELSRAGVMVNVRALFQSHVIEPMVYRTGERSPWWEVTGQTRDGWIIYAIEVEPYRRFWWWPARWGDIEVDIGSGPAGAEVTHVTLWMPSTWRRGRYVQPLRPALTIPAGRRIALRVNQRCRVSLRYAEQLTR